MTIIMFWPWHISKATVCMYIYIIIYNHNTHIYIYTYPIKYPQDIPMILSYDATLNFAMEDESSKTMEFVCFWHDPRFLASWCCCDHICHCHNLGELPVLGNGHQSIPGDVHISLYLYYIPMIDVWIYTHIHTFKHTYMCIYIYINTHIHPYTSCYSHDVWIPIHGWSYHVSHVSHARRFKRFKADLEAARVPTDESQKVGHMES